MVLELCKTHFCSASWLLLGSNKEDCRAREGRGDLLLPDSLLWSSCALLFLCVVSGQRFFTQAAAVPSLSNSWVRLVVFLKTCRTSLSILHTPPPLYSRHQHKWDSSISWEIWISVHGDPPLNFSILINLSSCLYFFMPWGEEPGLCSCNNADTLEFSFYPFSYLGNDFISSYQFFPLFYHFPITGKFPISWRDLCSSTLLSDFGNRVR